MGNQKSMAVAYLLWFFFGMLGIHRFYTGRTGTGVAQLLISLTGWATTFLIIGWFILPIVWIWLFVDIFLIPGLCRNPR